MGLKKTHKGKKSKKQVGKGMGTHGRGARKAGKDKGHKGGIGMAGSGKRADHHKTRIINMYGNTYFGKSGVTSRSTKKDKRDRINLKTIESNLDTLGKKTSKGWEINLPNHKILGTGEVGEKIIIKAKEASKSAKEKVEKSGGEIVLPDKKSEEKSGEGKQEKSEKSEKKKEENKKDKSENSKKSKK